MLKELPIQWNHTRLHLPRHAATGDDDRTTTSATVFASVTGYRTDLIQSENRISKDIGRILKKG